MVSLDLVGIGEPRAIRPHPLAFIHAVLCPDPELVWAQCSLVAGELLQQAEIFQCGELGELSALRDNLSPCDLL